MLTEKWYQYSWNIENVYTFWQSNSTFKTTWEVHYQKNLKTLKWKIFIKVLTSKWKKKKRKVRNNLSVEKEEKVNCNTVVEQNIIQPLKINFRK